MLGMLSLTRQSFEVSAPPKTAPMAPEIKLDGFKLGMDIWGNAIIYLLFT